MLTATLARNRAAEPTGRLPASASKPSSGVLPSLVGLTVCLLPFLSPAGPGNVAMADVAMALCIGLALLWVTRARLTLALPWTIGVGVMMLGGALAAVLSQAPGMTGLVLVQDALLLAWALVLATGQHDVRVVRAATVAWCRTAVVVAAVGVAGFLLGVGALSGVNAADGSRASYFFGDPNLAGNYFVVSLFVLAASRRPRTTGLRWLAYAVVVTAIAFTGSNGAALTLAAGLVSAFALSQYRRRGTQAGLLAVVAAAAVAVAISGFLLPRVDVDALRVQAAGSVPLLRDSIGRSDGSTGEREALLREAMGLFLRSSASASTTGVGPARTKVALRKEQAAYVKEAHNDYLATLLERGVVGCVGLLILIWAMVLRCRQLGQGLPGPDVSSFLPRPWLLVAVLPVITVAGAFYEVLHFRHVWTWLGLVAVLVLISQRERA